MQTLHDHPGSTQHIPGSKWASTTGSSPSKRITPPRDDTLLRVQGNESNVIYARGLRCHLRNKLYFVTLTQNHSRVSDVTNVVLRLFRSRRSLRLYLFGLMAKIKCVFSAYSCVALHEIYCNKRILL